MGEKAELNLAPIEANDGKVMDAASHKSSHHRRVTEDRRRSLGGYWRGHSRERTSLKYYCSVVHWCVVNRDESLLMSDRQGTLAPLLAASESGEEREWGLKTLPKGCQGRVMRRATVHKSVLSFLLSSHTHFLVVPLLSQ